MSGQVFGSEGLAINIAVYEKNVPVEVESDVIAFGDNVIKEAISLGASDIHIEPFKNTSILSARKERVCEAASAPVNAV